MGKVAYNISTISAKKLEYYENNSEKPGRKMTEMTITPSNTNTPIEVPLDNKANSTSVFRLFTGSDQMEMGGRTDWPTIFFDWQKCERNSCTDASDKTEQALNKAPKKKLYLDENVRVSALIYANVDSDRDTEILIKLTDGTALLIDQTSPGGSAQREAPKLKRPFGG